MQTLPENIPPSMVDGLARLEGRPLFFFDSLLPLVFAGPFPDKPVWPKDVADITDDSARRFAGRLAENLGPAWTKSKKDMKSRVSAFLTPSQDADGMAHSNIAEIHMLAQLLQGVYLEGGKLNPLVAPSGNLDTDKMKKAVQDGMFVWNPDEEGSILQEPSLIAALQDVGKERALNVDVATDVMFQVMADDVHRLQSCKGSRFEEAVAWRFLRACNKGPVLLSTLLADTAVPNFDLPKSLAKTKVHVTVADVAPKLEIETGKGGQVKVDNWPEMTNKRTIWHSFTHDAGMDLMLRTTDGTLIGIQVKSGQTNLPEAVASCTLGW